MPGFIQSKFQVKSMPLKLQYEVGINSLNPLLVAFKRTSIGADKYAFLAAEF